MIHIDVNRADGEMEIVTIGHANFAPAGQDIVCAAVSAIMQTAVYGLMAIAEQYPDHVMIIVTDEQKEQTGPSQSSDGPDSI